MGLLATDRCLKKYPDGEKKVALFARVSTDKQSTENQLTELRDAAKRLGWEAGTLNDSGGKPKGMHWKTYQRLKKHHDALVQVSFQDIARKLGLLHKLLEA